MDSHARAVRIQEGLEEVLTPHDLQHAIETNVPLKHYIGFEISGVPHIGAALKTMFHVRNFQEAKVDCSIFLADWHAWINDKLGGDKEAIARVGKGYFKECFLAAAKVANADADKIDFVLGSELYHGKDEYWETVIDIAKHTTLSRMQRSTTIMGRSEGENLDFAKLIYPVMQVADIYFQQLTLAHAGMDQRKAHVIARDVSDKLQYHGMKFNKKSFSPIALHHHLVMGLQKPPQWPIPKEKVSELRAALKMSKSVQGSAVFLHDDEKEIAQKIQHAFCMEKDLTYNPVLDWAEHMVFPFAKEMAIERPTKFGGNITYNNYKEVEQDFAEGKLHPMDLKQGVAHTLAEILTPARKHLSSPKSLKLREEFEQLKTTR